MWITVYFNGKYVFLNEEKTSMTVDGSVTWYTQYEYL